MIVVAIDPGPTESAWLQYQMPENKIVMFDKLKNPTLLFLIGTLTKTNKVLAIEMVQSFGMPVGADIFETAFWSGRFVQAWDGEWSKVYRKDVKMHLCNSMRAKDSNIRQALLDRFEPAGGGKTPQVGTKGEPGPLFGVKADIWSALAIAITFAETMETDDDA